MSVAHTTPAPAADAAGEGRRPSLVRWLTGGTFAATGLAILAIAVWPASEADKAYADGERYGEAVADQVAAQEDALSRAANGFVGALTTDDAFEAELYEYELDVALSDLSSDAEDFRTTGPEVQQAFWDGYETGLEG